jgi:hypothetical protein
VPPGRIACHPGRCFRIAGTDSMERITHFLGIPAGLNAIVARLLCKRSRALPQLAPPR